MGYLNSDLCAWMNSFTQNAFSNRAMLGGGAFAPDITLLEQARKSHITFENTDVWWLRCHDEGTEYPRYYVATGNEVFNPPTSNYYGRPNQVWGCRPAIRLYNIGRSIKYNHWV